MPSVDRSLVKELPLFSGLENTDLDAMLTEARSLRFSKGSPVFQQDEEAHSLYGPIRQSSAGRRCCRDIRG
jgi:hypothetical protein